MKDNFLIVLLVIFVLGTLYACNVTANNCEAKGGELARGTTWYVCVNEDSP